MEVVGTKRIFQRSIEKHGLRYAKFLGDGDSKSFPAVVDTYDGLKVKKLECIGHSHGKPRKCVPANRRNNLRNL